VAIPNVSATFTMGVNYQCQGAAEGAAYQPLTASGNPKKNIAFKTGTTASGQINELASLIQDVAASGTATVNLQSLLDVVGQTVDLVRIKGLVFQLLSTADDATNGTACSSVTVGNAGTNPHPLFMNAGTDRFILNNGEAVGWLSPSANGVAVSPTVKNVLITNNDSGNAAAVQITVLGADA
jgi:hypothetical protein